VLPCFSASSRVTDNNDGRVSVEPDRSPVFFWITVPRSLTHLSAGKAASGRSGGPCSRAMGALTFSSESAHEDLGRVRLGETKVDTFQICGAH